MSRCFNCPGTANCVGPDGPDYADILFVGEKPGREENAKKCVFIGKTGRELDEHYLPLAGLRRENVIITNTIRCYGGEGNKDKYDLNKQAHRDLLLSCADHHLYPHIERVKPKLIVPLGAFACYALDPDIDLELQHGIPTDSYFGKLFPMYHPAGGLHEPKRMLHIRSDWDRLRRYIRGELSLPNDPFAGREEYRRLDTPAGVDAVLEGRSSHPLACDTEIKRHNKRDPFCITFSTTPGTGYMVRADNRACLDRLQLHLNQWTGPILWHNWLFDYDVTLAMGLQFPIRLIVDTMVLVFHLGNLPQGLKALAYRELGMKMKDFDDVVTPHSRPLALRYLRDAAAVDWPKPPSEMKRDTEGGWKEYQPQSMKTKLKRFLTDYSKNPNIDVFERWKNWGDAHYEIESQCGQFPGKCISHVPFDESLWYACRDADSLIRLYPVIKKMAKAVRRTTAERWRGYSRVGAIA